jgi:two-component system, NarL family, nitrate/nitrite response regulator NarL
MNENRVLIVDDHPVMRMAIRIAISKEQDLALVGEAGTLAEGRRLAEELQPVLILLDLYLPDGNGLEFVCFRNEHLPDTKILVLTSSNNEDDILAVLKAGVEGIIGKDSPLERIQFAIRKVLAGNSYLMNGAANALMREYQKGETHREAQAFSLSKRELQVMGHLARGETNAEIAAGLFISESTIRTHIQRILHKIGLQNKNQLIIYAAKHYR